MGIDERLTRLAAQDAQGRVRVMIIGLGSVGNYLLSYLLGSGDDHLEVIVVGRDEAKMTCDVNIALVSALIRRECKTRVRVVGGVDLESTESVARCLVECKPDIIVNTSRVYAGLKYGSISWSNVRAYGIWTPLSIRYIRNIMAAYEQAGSAAIVINTSYSDGTIPWLKSAGCSYPDFGSGNLNHLVPRIRLAAARTMGIDDFWNVDVAIATGHFHDVVISKEGQAEGVEQLIRVAYDGRPIELDQPALLSLCAIPMPMDQKRNMMNASSNYEIIRCVLQALRLKTRERLFSPGAFGEIGGYPVVVDGSCASPRAFIDESDFPLAAMRAKNRASLALDGIEDIRNGCLFYTDALLENTRKAFGATLPKQVAFDDIDATAQFIIDAVIKPALAGK